MTDNMTSEQQPTLKRDIQYDSGVGNEPSNQLDLAPTLDPIISPDLPAQTTEQPAISESRHTVHSSFVSMKEFLGRSKRALGEATAKKDTTSYHSILISYMDLLQIGTSPKAANATVVRLKSLRDEYELADKSDRIKLEDEAKNELRILMNAKYTSNQNMVRSLMRDGGATETETDDYENSIPKLENVKEARRKEILLTIVNKRISLAIENFEMYRNLFAEIDPERTSEITTYDVLFRATAGIDAKQAEISEDVRAKLSETIIAKGTYYSEMLQTLLIEKGMEPHEAEETILAEFEIIQSLPIPEQVALLKKLKREAIDTLIASSDYGFDLFDKLHAGEGKNLKSLFENSDSERKESIVRNMYKVSSQDLESRRTEYQNRYRKVLKDMGEPTSKAERDSTMSTGRLRLLPRHQQLRVMELNLVV